VRAGDIIRKLRGLARTDDPRREPTDVNSLIEELTDLIQSDAKHHDTQCHLELAPHLPPVEIDRAQIQQVVLNLVRNAFEAVAETRMGMRTVTIRTALVSYGDVEICVCDTGNGVSPTVIDHLFDPFCTTKPAGTGLGLAMSRTIARAHRGTLEYRPNEPVGACFSLRIPPPPPAPEIRA
jgi:signal transduction histidine kinase